MAATFTYRVRDRQGKIIVGSLEGDSEITVANKLRQMEYIVLGIKEKAEVPSPGEVLMRFKRIKLKDLTVFSRQFATMINAGLSLTKCLNILSVQTENSALAKVIAEVQHDVEAGQALSDALAKHPGIFPPLFINMIRAGETGGVLDEVLLRIAEHYEKETTLKGRIKSAMAYPSAMFGFSMLILFAMITFVVPIFVRMFEGLGGELPLPTRILLAASGFMQSFWYIGLLITIALVYAFRWFGRTETGRLQIDRIKLHLPIIGLLIRKISIARFARTLGTLVSSGVPILQALDIVAETSGNAVVATSVMRTRSSIKEGETIARPLEESTVFPPMVVQMIAVGEETGALDSMLNKIADFYDSEVSATVDALTSLIEPLMIVVMGTLIGGIIISLYMPMFQVITLIK